MSDIRPIPSVLWEMFRECLKAYPELEVVELLLFETDGELSGAKGHREGTEYVILFVPRGFDAWSALRPIIHHELSHCVSLEDPDSIFRQRADKRSLSLWDKMMVEGLLKCSHGKETKCH